MVRPAGAAGSDFCAPKISVLPHFHPFGISSPTAPLYGMSHYPVGVGAAVIRLAMDKTGYGTSAVFIPCRDHARSSAFPQSFNGISCVTISFT